MPRRHPAVVRLAAEHARAKGVINRVAARLQSNRGQLKKAREAAMELEQKVAELERMQQAAQHRAEALAASLKLADSSADPAGIAAVHGWKEVHSRAWMNRRLVSLLADSGIEYVSTTVLAERLAAELDLSGKLLYDAVQWRSNVRYALKYLRQRGAAESMLHRRLSDNQAESCWRLRPRSTLDDLRAQAEQLAVKTAHMETGE